MQDLLREYNEHREGLTTAIRILKERGIAKAEKYAEYRKVRAVLTLNLLEQKYAITILQDVVRGDSKVAKARLDYDIAETLYETAKQKIYQIKLEMGIIEQQMITERRGE